VLLCLLREIVLRRLQALNLQLMLMLLELNLSPKLLNFLLEERIFLLERLKFFLLLQELLRVLFGQVSLFFLVVLLLLC
jgi:hypothetical protein